VPTAQLAGRPGAQEEAAMVTRPAGDDHADPDTDGHPTPVARHPLDPLDIGEIALAVEILRRERPVTPEARFVSVTLVPGARAPVTLAEYEECERVTRSDLQVRAGLERRGITSPERVLVEPWGIGTFTSPEDAGRRIVWTLLFYREQADDNPYATSSRCMSCWGSARRSCSTCASPARRTTSACRGRPTSPRPLPWLRAQGRHDAWRIPASCRHLPESADTISHEASRCPPLPERGQQDRRPT
jgi:Copper amine oxidase, N3 domain